MEQETWPHESCLDCRLRKGGVELLLRLHREGKLRFELTDPDNG